jgi:hypothetical protein
MAFLEFAINLCLTHFYELTGSYGLSLILLSFAVSLCLAPFYYLTGILENRERTIKQRLDPFIQKINAIKDSEIRHFQLKELYKSFSYYPFYVLRSLASLFIQIPMLFAAYGVLTKNPLDGEQFLLISDLGKADFLLFGINLLPIAMTAINIASVLLSAKAGSPERRHGIFIAMLFFILLYKQNSALLIYWSFNQFFNFVRYAFVFKTSNLAKPKISLAEIRSLFIPKPLPLNFILAFAAMAFPAILIYKQNSVYFVGMDLPTYIAVFFGISLVIALLFKYWVAVALILSFMFFPMLRQAGNIVDSYGYVLSRILCAAVFLYFIHFFAKQKLLLMIFFISTAIYSVIFVKDETSKPVAVPSIEIPQDLANLELKDSSSIYLFMHDAFPHKDIANHFDIKYYDELMDILKENGFNIYDVYSLVDNTLLTMYSLFQITTDSLPISNGINTAVKLGGKESISLNYYLRYFLSGNNITNLLLKSKGYKTGISNTSNRWFFQKENNAYDFWTKDTTNNNLLLKEVLKGENFYRVMSNFIDLNLNFAEHIAKNGDKSKIFAWTTAGPGHTRQSLNTTKEAEYENWMPRYNEAIRDMKIEIDSLVKNNSIIIFMSDHGPFLVDVPRLTKDYDFNKTDYIKFRDVFGAFMAIRFPDRERASKYDKEFTVTQNLFPIIFAYLFDSEIPLKYKIQNTELRLGPHKFDKGVFYPYFYSGEPK